MTKRLITLMVLFALATGMALVPAGAGAAPKKHQGRAFPVVGQGTAAGVGAVTFAGELFVQEFEAKHGQVVAVGRLSGAVTDAAGKTLGTVTDRKVKLPVTRASNAPAAAAGAFAAQQIGCEILALDLGPLHLDLLGLVVDLNQVVLTITAVPGAGNLLGNLLCAVVGLLDPILGGAFLELAADLLNAVIEILNGVGG